MLETRRISALVLFTLLTACSRGASNDVVVYTAVDEIYAREIFAACERETGLRVRAVYDTEEAKSLGLAMRIVAERETPRADVFWNGEPSRTEMLKRESALAEYNAVSGRSIAAEWRDAAGHWTGFAARARVIVYNTRKVASPPKTFDELTQPQWRGRAAMSNPAFGTMAAHAVALAQERGEDEAIRLLAALKANAVRIVGGNSHVRDLVAKGDCDVGLTDTDDVWIGKLRGDPIDLVYPAPTLVIPNTVSLIRGAPNRDNAVKFIEWLLRRETEELLAKGPSRQIPVRGDALPEHRLKIDWSKVTTSRPFFDRVRKALDL